MEAAKAAAEGKRCHGPTSWTSTTSILIFVTLGKFLHTTGFRCFYVFAPFLAKTFDLTLAEFNRVLVSTELAGLIAAPFAGALLSKVGMHRYMIVTLAVAGLATAGPILGKLDGFSGIFQVLLICRFIFGACRALNNVSLQHFIGEYVPKERMGRVGGIVESSWGAASFVGIPLVGLLLDSMAWEWAFAVMALVFAPLLPILAFLFRKGRRKKFQRGSRSSRHLIAEAEAQNASLVSLPVAAVAPDGQQEKNSRKGGGCKSTACYLLRNPTMWFPFFAAFLHTTAISILFTNYGRWLVADYELTVTQLGASGTVIGVAELVSELAVALLADSLGLERSCIFSGAALSASFITLCFLGESSIVAALACVFLIFFFFEYCAVAMMMLAAHVAKPQFSATYLGIFFACMSGGFMTGAATANTVWLEGGIVLTGSLCASLAFAESLLWTSYVCCSRRGLKSNAAVVVVEEELQEIQPGGEAKTYRGVDEEEKKGEPEV